MKNIKLSAGAEVWLAPLSNEGASNKMVFREEACAAAKLEIENVRREMEAFGVGEREGESYLALVLREIELEEFLEKVGGG
jgi:hypothetical protein